jgi:hypothetical protein
MLSYSLAYVEASMGRRIAGRRVNELQTSAVLHQIPLFPVRLNLKSYKVTYSRI